MLKRLETSTMQWRFFIAFLQCCAFAAGVAMAQSPARPASEPAQHPSATIKSTTRLVLVDVIVLDRAQKPVPNLTANDFTIHEDGQPQTIKSFEPHFAASPAPAIAGESATQDDSAHGIFTNAPPTAASGNLNVLLIDTLNTQVSEQSYLHSQLQSFLKSQSGTNRLAIFSLRNNRLVLLQRFTTDTRLLEAAVNQGQVIATSALLSDPTGLSGRNPTVRQTTQGRETQLLLRDRLTLAAINELASYLAQFPGRKNLFWFAGSFPLSIYPDVSIPEAEDPDLTAADKLRATSRLLTQARIAVYPVDARGAPAPFASDAVDSEAKYVKRPDLFAIDMSNAAADEDNDHLIMEQMARDTGGKAFYNTNGISQAVAGAIDTAGRSYTLAYTPSNRQASGDYRTIDVSVAGGKYTLAYRRGYFAEASLDESSPAQQGLSEAMRMGGPDAMQVVFKARVLPVSNTTEAAAAPGNRPDSKAKGTWRRFQVDLAADPRPIRWTRTSDGLAQSRVEFVALIYDQEGRVVNSFSDTITHTFTRAEMLEASRTGLGLSGQISTPAKGNYWLRIGIHDLASGSIGTLELPVASVRDIPVAKAP